MKYSVEDLCNSTKKLDFEFFYGGIYSQWFPCKFHENGIMFNSAEQYMMFKKAILFDNFYIADKILSLDDPREIKSLGREVVGFDEKLWNEHKFKIVRKGNLLKFSQKDSLRTQLLSTGDKIIVEASPYDCIWGIGLSEIDPNVRNISHWRGENLLGFAIMEVRDLLNQISV